MDYIFWMGNGTWKPDSWLYMVYYDSWNSIWKAVFQDGKTLFHAIWCECDRIKEKIKKHMEDSGVDKIDADTAKVLLKSDDSKSDFGIGTTDEVRRGIEAVSKGTDKKPQKTFDKKQAVSAIEDAMLAGTTKASSSDLSKMLRELKTLKEKSKNNNGTTIVDLAEFTKGLSDKFE